MRKNFYSVIFFILASFIITIISAPFAYSKSKKESKVAIIYELKGKVSVFETNAKRWHKASLMKLLQAGDRIKVDKSSMAVIVFFRDGHGEKISSPGEVTIGEKALIAEQGKKLIIAQIPPDKDLPLPQTSNNMSDQILGVTYREVIIQDEIEPLSKSYELNKAGESGTILTINPNMAIMTGTPSFKWVSVPESKEYQFKLMDENEHPVWQRTVVDNALTYPSDEKPLEWGKRYYWEVKAYRENKIIAMGFSSFDILTEKNIEEIRFLQKKFQNEVKKEPLNKNLYVRMSVVYLENKLYDEALPLLLKLESMVPEDPSIHAWLGVVYRNKGMQTESDKEFNLSKKYEKK